MKISKLVGGVAPGSLRALFVLSALVLVASFSASAAHAGQSTYDTECAPCHGKDGSGMMEGQPDFGDETYWNSVTDEEVTQIVKEGSTNGAMPAFGDKLTDEEIANVLAYEKLFAEEEEVPKAMPDTRGSLTEELEPHEIGVVNFLVLFIVMIAMFGVNRVLREDR